MASSTNFNTSSLGGLQSDKATQYMNYARTVLDPIIQPMVKQLMIQQPNQPIDTMIHYLQQLKQQNNNNNTNTQQREQTDYDNNNTDKQFDTMDAEHKTNDDDNTTTASTSIVRGSRGRRAAVSAEPINTSDLSINNLRVIPKSGDDISSIKSAIKNNILFKHIDNDSMNAVINAMEQKQYNTNDVIIQQGDNGNEFYVLASGLCDCYVNDKFYKQYTPGESFGELALMYNVVRQATIRATTTVSLWAMDRLTFQTVIMSNTIKKREQYESFLSNVQILQSLDKYELSKIADALVSQTYNKNEYIIKQGDTNDNKFYILVSGSCKAIKILPDTDGEALDVYTYNKQGDYFGELALINDQPRQASVICTEDNTTVISLDLDSFVRLLGPVDKILKRNSEEYTKIDKKVSDNRRATLRQNFSVQDALKQHQQQQNSNINTINE